MIDKKNKEIFIDKFGRTKKMDFYISNYIHSKHFFSIEMNLLKSNFIFSFFAFSKIKIILQKFENKFKEKTITHDLLLF